MKYDDFHELNIKNIKKYLFSLEFIQKIHMYEKLEVVDISNGINLVFLISFYKNSHPKIVLKQALSFFREHKYESISQNRLDAEIQAYEVLHKHIPEQLPQIYYTSKDMKIIIMQYIDGALCLEDLFCYKIKHPTLTKDVAHFLSKSLFHTSSFCLTTPKKKELIDIFNKNSEICALTEMYVFTDSFPSKKHTTNHSSKHFLHEILYIDKELQKSILELKYKFMTRSDSLIHGDFKSGCFLLTEKKTYIIDFEFAFVGPFGYDMGSFFYSLIAAAVSHSLYENSLSYQEWLLDAIIETFEYFESEFKSIFLLEKNGVFISANNIDATLFDEFRNHIIEEFLQESIAYAAVQMSAKMISLLPIESKYYEKKEEYYFKIMFQISKIFLKEYKSIKDIQTVVKIVRTLIIK